MLDTTARHPNPLPLVAIFILDSTHAFICDPSMNASSDAAVVRGMSPKRWLKLSATAWFSGSIGAGRILTRPAASATNALMANPIQITFMALR